MEEMRRKMNQKGQKTYLKLACSSFLPLCSPSPVRSRPRSPGVSLNLSLLSFLGQPPPTSLLLHQPAWLLHHQHGPCHAHATDFPGAKAPLYFKRKCKGNEKKSFSPGPPPTKGVYNGSFTLEKTNLIFRL